jgi:HSP20 family protein
MGGEAEPQKIRGLRDQEKEVVMMPNKWRTLTLPSLREIKPIEAGGHVVDGLLASWPFRTWRRSPDEVSWSPPVEMYEKADRFVVRVELPGVKKDEIDVSVTGEALTVRGERELPKQAKDEEYHRCEVCYGSFSRSIAMPAAVDVDEIEATYEDGVLQVSLPKTKDAKASKVEIRAKGN